MTTATSRPRSRRRRRSGPESPGNGSGRGARVRGPGRGARVRGPGRGAGVTLFGVGLAARGGRLLVRRGTLLRIRPVVQAGHNVLEPRLKADDRLAEPPFTPGGPGPLTRPALVAPPGPGRS